MGQDVEVFEAAAIDVDVWDEAEAPARRRRWYEGPDDTLAVLLASASDVDDLVPTLVAFQIEWNKIRQRMRAAGWPIEGMTPEACAAEARRQRRRLGAAAGGVGRALRRADGAGRGRPAVAARADARRLAHRLRAADAPLVGAGARGAAGARGSATAPLYFISSNTHSIVNIATGVARDREDELVGSSRRCPTATSCAPSSTRSARASRGLVGELPVLRRPRLLGRARRGGPRGARRRRSARSASRTCARKTALRVPAQIMPLGASGTRRSSTRGWAPSTPSALAASRRGDREHRLSARRRGVQHPARGGRRQRARCAASTCSARRRR